MKTLENLNHLLNAVVAGLFGNFVGQSIFNYIDYRRMPDIYAMRSGTWYDYYALPSFIIFGVVVSISLIVKSIILILKRKKRKSR